MDISDPSEGQRKRQIADVEGFILPPKNKTAKANLEKAKAPPITIANQFQSLCSETSQAGPSRDRAQSTVKARKMPPIVAKVKAIDTTFVNAVKAQTSGLVTFEYTAGGLKIRPESKSDHHNIVVFLKGKGVEYFTFNPNPEQNMRFVLRGLPPNTESDEVVAGLREKGIEVSHARQIKRNAVIDGVRTVTLLPLWVITVLKTEENITKLKATTGILNFLVRIQDYKTATNKIIQCFRCQNFGHKAEFCNIAEKCVKCAGDHSSRTCPKEFEEPARCANCNGQHSANYLGCPEVKKYQERRGLTRAPQRPQQQRRPNVSSNVEFPALPRRQRVELPTPTPQAADGMGDLKEIISLFTSGTIRSYLTKFKTLIGQVKQQPDPMSKMMTFCFGLVELFD
jgi:Arginine methyltransferase-interacting protein, contains RING Zn-finger